MSRCACCGAPWTARCLYCGREGIADHMLGAKAEVEAALTLKGQVSRLVLRPAPTGVPGDGVKVMR